MFGDFDDCGMEGREDTIDRYLLGELSLEEINKLTTHLLECKSCLAELEFRDKLKEVIEDDGDTIFADSARTMLPERRRTRSVGFVHGIRGYVKYPWVVAILVIAMVTTTSMLVFLDRSQPVDFLAELRLDEKVPVPFEPDYLSILRASSQSQRTRVDSLTTSFLAAMRFYLEMDYAGTVQALDALESEIEGALAQSDSAKSVPYMVRDYLFFRSIAVFANCRHDIETRAPALVGCLGKALAGFQQSFAFAEANELAQVDGCRYFQGLSDALLGNRLTAINTLEKVDATSSFFNDAVRLVASLNKE